MNVDGRRKMNNVGEKRCKNCANKHKTNKIMWPRVEPNRAASRNSIFLFPSDRSFLTTK